jgi:hypothetical protein
MRGYTRRSYGNLFATRNLNVARTDFTEYCVPAPTDSRLPGAGSSLCGLFDLNRIIAPNNLIFNSSKVGGIDDVYDGFDFNANARPARNVIISGGVSLGRERVNNCNIAKDVSLSVTGTARPNEPRVDAFCDVRPPFQPLVKGQIAYPLPWDVNVSATFQSLPGPELRAQYPLNNAIALPSLGRNFTTVAPTIDILPSGVLYGDRIYQTDLRFSRTVRTGGTTSGRRSRSTTSSTPTRSRPTTTRLDRLAGADRHSAARFVDIACRSSSEGCAVSTPTPTH